jgi:type II secretion system protein I
MWMSWLIGSPVVSPSPADKRQAGFTLLEVLIALAILGVALVASMQALSGALASTRRAEAAGQALLTARSLLERVGTELPIASGSRSGSEAGLAWTLAIARHPEPAKKDKQGAADHPFAAFEIVVTVAAQGAAPVSLSTVRLARLP